jgi:hypothetical protein
MVGNIQEQDLRRADQERDLDLRRVGGQAALEQSGQEMAQRAEAPQRSRDQDPHQRAVALLQRAERLAAVELLIQRALSVKNGAEDVSRCAASGKARGFGRRHKNRHALVAGVTWAEA